MHACLFIERIGGELFSPVFELLWVLCEDFQDGECMAASGVWVIVGVVSFLVLVAGTAVAFEIMLDIEVESDGEVSASFRDGCTDGIVERGFLVFGEDDGSVFRVRFLIGSYVGHCCF